MLLAIEENSVSWSPGNTCGKFPVYLTSKLAQRRTKALKWTYTVPFYLQFHSKKENVILGNLVT